MKSKFLNKNGFTNIHVIIVIVFCLIAVCVFSDILFLTPRTNVMNSTVDYIADVVSRQGGLSSSPFHGYSISEFTTTPQAVENIREMMEDAGYPESNYSLTINGVNIISSPSTTVGPFDFGENITIVLRVNNTLTLTNSIIPGTNDINLSTRRITTSQYSIRNKEPQ